MHNSSAILFVLLQVPFVLPVNAGDLSHGKIHFEECMNTVLSAQPGRVIKVEMKLEDNAKVYEFDIRDMNGIDWDLECHADTGQIIETERELISLLSSEFKDRINYSVSESRAIALKKYPGEILEQEYEIEADNRVVYEFDIRLASGDIMKVEIDAATGEFHEENRELWQIGYE